jgi:hypothetical protein
MPEPRDKDLYEKVKKEVSLQYAKPSAYRSGAFVKRYKEEFRKKYGDKIEPYVGNDKRELQTWFLEEWEDVNPFKTSGSYPVFRPTKIIDPLSTPLTVSEIDPEDFKKKAILKQKLKGKWNLPPFEPKS